MENELIVIEPGTELAIFTSPTNVELLLAKVRENVMSLEGGSMRNKTTRKIIRSNAFTATKAKKAFKVNHIEPLLESLQLKIKPTLDTIALVKASANEFYDGLDQIRKDVNKEVDELEAELERVAAAEAEVKRLADIAERIDLIWDYAHFQLSQFNLAELMTFDLLADQQRLHDEEIARVAAEKAKREAEEAAQAKIDAAAEAERKAKAEKEAAEAKAKQDVIDLKAKQADDLRKQQEETERQRQAAIQAEIELEEAEQRRIAKEKEDELLAIQREQDRVKREADQAEVNRVDYHKRMVQHIVDCGNGIIGGQVQPIGLLMWELQNKIVIDNKFEEFEGQAVAARDAAIKKLTDLQEKQAQEGRDLEARNKIIEENAAKKARNTAIAEQKQKDAEAAEKLETRKRNNAHIGSIRKAQEEYLMSKGISEAIAKDVALGMAKGEMPHCNVIY